MLFYLLKLDICGIKNIERPISIEFYKKTIANDFDPDEYRVKGIYGENGSGKTAVITAVSLLQKLILDDLYLSNFKTQKKLVEIINKKNRACSVGVDFYYTDAAQTKLYHYEVGLKIDEGERVVLCNEKLMEKEGRYSKNVFKTVYEVNDGVLLQVQSEKSVATYIKEKTSNLLQRQTFSSSLIHILSSNKKKGIVDFGRRIHVVNMFALSTIVYMDESDHHVMFFLRKKIEEMSDLSGDDLQDSINEVKRALLLGSSEERIPKRLLGFYQEHIGRLCEFIKIFKPDLKTIDIDKKEDGDYYRYNLVMVYEAYQLDIEFESKGIKKLVNMFSYLQAASNDYIVFIDELDSNINDVYLDKIIEYLVYYGKGQLCFTAHNLSPMSILKESKEAITFISSINTVHTWTSQGNKNPENAYRNGFIEDSPFNVQASDFLGILGGIDA